MKGKAIKNQHTLQRSPLDERLPQGFTAFAHEFRDKDFNAVKVTRFPKVRVTSLNEFKALID